ncbi:MAG: hypothetical protein OXU70_11125 [Gammaproteobacteria bacterium]|nr:hypothetical protein [Gammaproteobacteria bacterium]
MSEVAAALAPHLLWALVLAVVLWCVGGTAVRDVLSRVKGVEFGGVRIDIESAVESAAAAQDVEVSRRASRAVAERLRRAQGRVAAMRLLWIDDDPTGNAEEMRILKGLGATIDLARSNKDARERLAVAVYDIVLSDIKRGEQGDEGIRFLPEALDALLSPPVIFYVAESKGTPNGAFGIATRPDELMHLIVDALERRGS